MGWRVMCYNSYDAAFGYDCGAFCVYDGLDKATAKSIARYLQKKTYLDCGVFYYWEQVPEDLL